MRRSAFASPLLVGLALMALALAGCSGDASDQSSATPGGAAGAAAPAKAPGDASAGGAAAVGGGGETKDSSVDAQL